MNENKFGDVSLDMLVDIYKMHKTMNCSLVHSFCENYLLGSCIKTEKDCNLCQEKNLKEQLQNEIIRKNSMVDKDELKKKLLLLLSTTRIPAVTRYTVYDIDDIVTINYVPFKLLKKCAEDHIPLYMSTKESRSLYLSSDSTPENDHYVLSTIYTYISDKNINTPEYNELDYEKQIFEMVRGGNTHIVPTSFNLETSTCYVNSDNLQFTKDAATIKKYEGSIGNREYWIREIMNSYSGNVYRDKDYDYFDSNFQIRRHLRRLSLTSFKKNVIDQEYRRHYSVKHLHGVSNTPELALLDAERIYKNHIPLFMITNSLSFGVTPGWQNTCVEFIFEDKGDADIQYDLILKGTFNLSNDESGKGQREIKRDVVYLNKNFDLVKE